MNDIKIEKNIPIPKQTKIYKKIFGFRYPFDKMSRAGDSFLAPIDKKCKTDIEKYFFAKRMQSSICANVKYYRRNFNNKLFITTKISVRPFGVRVWRVKQNKK